MKLRSWVHSTILTSALSAKWCSSCQQSRYRKNGEYIKSSDGLRQRWICSWCIERRNNATKVEVST